MLLVESDTRLFAFDYTIDFDDCRCLTSMFSTLT